MNITLASDDHFFISLNKLGKMSSMKNCAWQKVTKVSSCGRKRLWLSQRQRSLSLSSVILVNMLNNRRKEKSRGSVENWWQKSHKKSYQGLKFKENDFQIAIGAVINIRCFWEHVREKKAYFKKGILRIALPENLLKECHLGWQIIYFSYKLLQSFAASVSSTT